MQVANIHAENYRDIASVEEAISVMNGIVGDKAYMPEEILTFLTEKLGGGAGDGDGNGDGDGDGTGDGAGDGSGSGGGTGGGSGGGGTPPAPTFTVTENEGVVTFSGTATGHITFTVGEDGDATFVRGGVTAANTVEFESIDQFSLASGQVLVITLEQAESVEITGAGSYRLANTAGDLGDLTVAQAKILEGAANANDYSYEITAGSFADADGVVFTNATSVSLSSSEGSQTITGSAGDDTFAVDFGAGHFTTGEDGVVIDGGAGEDTLSVWHGDGNVTLEDGHFENISNMEILSLASAGDVTNTVTLGENADAAFANGITVVVEEENGLNLNASAMTVAVNATGGNGANNLTGGSGNDVLTGGSGTNTIAGGKGADQIILAEGAGVDTIVVGGGVFAEEAEASSANVTVTDVADVSSVTIKLGGTDYVLNAAAIAAAENGADLAAALEAAFQAELDDQVTVVWNDGESRLEFSDAAGRGFSEDDFAVVTNTITQEAVASSANVTVTDVADVSSVSIKLGGTDYVLNAAAIAAAENGADLAAALEAAF
ncbi:hypothetical protein [Nitrosomonas halophila]|uniref:Hemolysin-type calcium-binding repeat-containing protein n=1 Tax=Nitrosomonas halophila TaxID=44576 RepID=A0A1H3N5R6_9PROT|nr:hypothetical protein [Nitrosomonas halophila]SDY84287.1 hypothetical protein SAMN05421881_106811 [Nitrosomonas halophila]